MSAITSKRTAVEAFRRWYKPPIIGAWRGVFKTTRRPGQVLLKTRVSRPSFGAKSRPNVVADPAKGPRTLMRAMKIVTGLALSVAVASTVTAAGASATQATSTVALPHTLLADTAFIMGASGVPMPSAGYVDAAVRLYLEPLGFDGIATALYTPQRWGSTDLGLPDDERYILDAVHNAIANGAVNADNPLWLFGYSQSAAAAALAAQTLHDEGVPAEYLHFVLIGNPASAHGGFLNTLMESIPAWLHPLVNPLLPYFGVAESIGLRTPGYYPTDVFSFSNDGYARWPANIFDLSAVNNALKGMFDSHTNYLGLTVDQIPDRPDHVDGLANYYTIDVDSINGFMAGLNAALNVLGFGWLTELFA